MRDSLEGALLVCVQVSNSLFLSKSESPTVLIFLMVTYHFSLVDNTEETVHHETFLST